MLRQGKHMSQVLVVRDYGYQSRSCRLERRLWLSAYHVGILWP